jgi:hypothetical protein
MTLQELLSNCEVRLHALWSTNEADPNLIDDIIHLNRLRELNVQAPSQSGRPAFVSAASGLVRIGQRLYVVADDELHIGVFGWPGNEPGELLRILPGDLPPEPQRRKRAKADFEALLQLPRFGDYLHGALIALGSGSRTQRHRAVLLPLTADDGIDLNGLRVLDFTSLYASVAREVGTVNIEGAIAMQGKLWLLQRGNKGDGVNAIVRFDLAEFCAAIERSGVVSSLAVSDVHRCNLGAIRDIPLGFSDGAMLTERSIVFAAIAEDTNDSYADGPCAGAAIGIIDEQGSVVRIACVHETAKIEGVSAETRGSTAQLLLVSDADDPNVPSTLHSAELDLAGNLPRHPDVPRDSPLGTSVGRR